LHRTTQASKLTYDALRILDFNADALGAIDAEMQELTKITLMLFVTWNGEGVTGSRIADVDVPNPVPIRLMASTRAERQPRERKLTR